MPKKPRLPRAIKTEKDVRDFFRYLYIVDRVSFHPDERFHSYGHGDPSGDWVRLYTPEQADRMDWLMRQAWAVVGGDIYDYSIRAGELYGPRPQSPKALAALKEMAQEKIDDLPESDLTHSLFNCLDLIVGDLDLVFLRPDDWYSQDNGFVFDAEELLSKGAKFRPKDLLRDYHLALEAVVHHRYRSVNEARSEIEAMIDCVQGSSQHGGREAIRLLKEILQKKGLFKGYDTSHMEIVWPGPLPLDLAIEAWQDGVNVSDRL